MAFKTHLVSSNLSGRSTNKPKQKVGENLSTFYGRVVHVVLSVDDPYCVDHSMVNGIYYSPLGKIVDESDITKLPFAYQGSSQQRTIPLTKEIVLLQKGADLKALSSANSTKVYWKEVVNIWNSPHHNAAPDTIQEDWVDNTVKNFPEKKNINPLRAYPGDTLIEGRLGQSIRLGGSAVTTPDTDTSDGDPVIIISNGQVETDNGFEAIDEDINEDFNSIYLLSNHQVPLKVPILRNKSYLSPVIEPDQFTGNQIVLTGGRLVLNAKEDSILLFSKNAIGLTGNTLNLESTEYVCMDSKKIYLGEKSLKTPNLPEPAVRGADLEKWLTILLNMLENLGRACQTATTVGGQAIPELNMIGSEVILTGGVLKKRFSSFKSKKVFIE